LSNYKIVLHSVNAALKEALAAKLSQVFAIDAATAGQIAGAAPIILIEGLTKEAAFGVNVELAPLIESGASLAIISAEQPGLSKVNWPGAVSINGKRLAQFASYQIQAMPLVQCPGCGELFRIVPLACIKAPAALKPAVPTAMPVQPPPVVAKAAPAVPTAMPVQPVPVAPPTQPPPAAKPVPPPTAQPVPPSGGPLDIFDPENTRPTLVVPKPPPGSRPAPASADDGIPVLPASAHKKDDTSSFDLLAAFDASSNSPINLQGEHSTPPALGGGVKPLMPVPDPLNKARSDKGGPTHKRPPTLSRKKTSTKLKRHSSIRRKGSKGGPVKKKIPSVRSTAPTVKGPAGRKPGAPAASGNFSVFTAKSGNPKLVKILQEVRGIGQPEAEALAAKTIIPVIKDTSKQMAEEVVALLAGAGIRARITQKQ